MLSTDQNVRADKLGAWMRMRLRGQLSTAVMARGPSSFSRKVSQLLASDTLTVHVTAQWFPSNSFGSRRHGPLDGTAAGDMTLRRQQPFVLIAGEGEDALAAGEDLSWELRRASYWQRRWR